MATITHRRRALAPCGTFAAYQRHHRHGETPCGPCRASLSATRGDRVAFQEAIASGVMVARPELAVLPMFGAAHYAGLVMGA